MIYLHVMNRPGLAVTSPLDRLGEVREEPRSMKLRPNAQVDLPLQTIHLAIILVPISALSIDSRTLLDTPG